MIIESRSTWQVLGFLLLQCMPPADVQMAMGMYPSYAQPYAYMPPPMPYPPAMMAMPAAVAFIQQKTATTTTTTTSTTTEAPIQIAVGVPVAVPYPFAMPAMTPPGSCQQRPRPPQCPPCPPCLCTPCTPAFFSYCSPCHQKCRCQNGQKPPQPLPIQTQPAFAMPMPMPMQLPSPVVVLPFSRDSRQDSSSSSWEKSSSEASCEEPSYRKRRTSNGGRLGYRPRMSRKNLYSRRMGREGLVKPILSYVAQNGDVKFESKISNVEAIELLRNKHASLEEEIAQSKLDENLSSNRRAHRLSQVPHNVEVMAIQDGDTGRHKVVVLANQPRQLTTLRKGVSEQQLKAGRKELVFNAPKNKRISNMSVSFQIVR